MFTEPLSVIPGQDRFAAHKEGGVGDFDLFKLVGASGLWWARGGGRSGPRLLAKSRTMFLVPNRLNLSFLQVPVELSAILELVEGTNEELILVNVARGGILKHSLRHSG